MNFSKIKDKGLNFVKWFIYPLYLSLKCNKLTFKKGYVEFLSNLDPYTTVFYKYERIMLQL